MKKKLAIIIFSTFLGSISTVYAQDASVEDTVEGIQIGLLGVWVHGEKGVSKSIVIRGEAGLDFGALINSVSDDISGFIAVPVLTIEPRWYYNLNKRQEKSRRIDGNSGNFLSVKNSFHPDIVLFAQEDNISFISDLSIIPTWGIRRSIGDHFNFETGIGLGYVFYFPPRDVILRDKSELILNLHLRFGYRF